MLRPVFATILVLVSCCGSAFAHLSDLPELNALQAWNDHSDMTEDGINAYSYPSKSVKCGNILYPSHPQQDLKQYHVYRTAEYDQMKVSGSDIVCLTHGSGRNIHGEIPCLRPDMANDVILSDVFMDSCGELYRGFVQIDFLSQDETMGTLMSRGRTMYPKPNAEFSGDYVSGDTYAVPKSYFWKIGPIFPGDLQKVNEDRLRAQSGYTYNSSSHLFIAK